MSDNARLSEHNLALVARIQSSQAGSTERTQAQTELLDLNAGLVHAIINHSLHSAAECDRADVLQLGLLEMLKCADKFDLTDQRASFASYAFSCIKPQVWKWLRSVTSLIHVPERHFESNSTLSDALADKSMSARCPQSLQEHVVGDHSTTMEELIPDESSVTPSENREFVAGVLRSKIAANRHLTPPLRDVVLGFISGNSAPRVSANLRHNRLRDAMRILRNDPAIREYATAFGILDSDAQNVEAHYA